MRNNCHELRPCTEKFLNDIGKNENDTPRLQGKPIEPNRTVAKFSKDNTDKKALLADEKENAMRFLMRMDIG